jgi:threonine dehydrogenase-like Zn-dependent dehydrogenase
MRAALMYGAGDVRVETVPDPKLVQPTDALVRIVRACICGSDLHPYHQMTATEQGSPMGHEFVGIVEEIGAEVRTLKAGDFVIAPFAWSDNTCDFCREGFDSSPARSSTAPSASTASQPGTRPWTPATRSR